jgi:hypothetical protein
MSELQTIWRSSWAFLGVGALIFVLAALANGGAAQWGDSGLFLANAVHNPWFAPNLSEMSHPLFHLVATAAYRLGGAGALVWMNVALLPLVGWLAARIARQLGAAPATAAAAGAAAIGMHGVLWVSIRVEVYVLHLVLVLACWWTYLGGDKRSPGVARTLAVGALAGMALSVHQLTAIVLLPVAMALLWWAPRRVPWALLGVLLGLFACAPAYLAAREQGISVLDIARGFMTGGHQAGSNQWERLFLRPDQLLAKAHQVAAVLISVFGAGTVGLLFRPKDPRALLLWVAALMNLIFAVTYQVPDRFTFFLPGGVMLVILGVLEMGRRDLGSLGRRWMMPMILAPLVVCHVLPMVAGDWLIKLPRVKSPAPYLNPLTFVLAPLHPDRSAERFVREFDRQVPPGAVVYAEYQSQQALLSAQAVGQFAGREVRSCEEFDEKRLASAPTYLVQALDCEVPRRHAVETLPLGFRLGPPGAAKR